jgi:hypothetical protein
MSPAPDLRSFQPDDLHRFSADRCLGRWSIKIPNPIDAEVADQRRKVRSPSSWRGLTDAVFGNSRDGRRREAEKMDAHVPDN